MERFPDFRPYKRVSMTDQEVNELLQESAVQFVVEDQEWKTRDVSVAETTPYFSLTGI